MKIYQSTSLFLILLRIKKILYLSSFLHTTDANENSSPLEFESFQNDNSEPQENTHNQQKESNNNINSEFNFEENMKTLIDMLQSMKCSEENTYKFNPNIKKDNQILSKRSHSPDPESNERKNSGQYILN